MESDGNIFFGAHKAYNLILLLRLHTFGRPRKVAGIVYSEVMIELHCAY